MSSKYKKYMDKGLSHQEEEKYTHAKESYEIALKIAKMLNDDEKICDTYNKLGSCLNRLGDYLKCIEYFLTVDHLAEKNGFKLLQIKAKNYLGNNYRVTRQFEEAYIETKKGIEICEEILKNNSKNVEIWKYRFQMSRLLQTLAVIEMNKKKIETSSKHLDQALKINERILELFPDNKYYKMKRSTSLSLKGSLLMLRENFSEAERYFNNSFEIAQEIDNQNQISSNFYYKMILEYKRGNFGEVKKNIIKFEESHSNGNIENIELKIRFSLLKSVLFLRENQIVESFKAIFEAQNELFNSQSFYRPYDLLEFYKIINSKYNNLDVINEIDRLLDRSEVDEKKRIDPTFLSLNINYLPEYSQYSLINNKNSAELLAMVGLFSLSFLKQYKYYIEYPKKFEYYFHQNRNILYRKFRNANLSNIDDLAIAIYIEKIQKNYSDAIQKLFCTYEMEMKRNFLLPLRKIIEKNESIKKNLEEVLNQNKNLDYHPKSVISYFISNTRNEPTIYLTERLIEYIFNIECDKHYDEWKPLVLHVKSIINNCAEANLRKIQEFSKKQFNIGDETECFRKIRNNILHKNSNYVNNIKKNQYLEIKNAYLGDFSAEYKKDGIFWNILSLNFTQ